MKNAPKKVIAKNKNKFNFSIFVIICVNKKINIQNHYDNKFFLLVMTISRKKFQQFQIIFGN